MVRMGWLENACEQKPEGNKGMQVQVSRGQEFQAEGDQEPEAGVCLACMKSSTKTNCLEWAAERLRWEVTGGGFSSLGWSGGQGTRLGLYSKYARESRGGSEHGVS